MAAGNGSRPSCLRVRSAAAGPNLTGPNGTMPSMGARRDDQGHNSGPSPYDNFATGVEFVPALQSNAAVSGH
jgi:hypothetical protein